MFKPNPKIVAITAALVMGVGMAAASSTPAFKNQTVEILGGTPAPNDTYTGPLTTPSAAQATSADPTPTNTPSEQATPPAGSQQAVDPTPEPTVSVEPTPTPITVVATHQCHTFDNANQRADYYITNIYSDGHSELVRGKTVDTAGAPNWALDGLCDPNHPLVAPTEPF